MTGPIISESMGLLPEQSRRSASFLQSLCLNVIVSILVLWLSVHLRQTLVTPRYVSTQLIFPAQRIKPLPTPPLKATLPPRVKALEKIEAPRPTIEPAPLPVAVRLTLPAMPLIPPSPLKAVVTTPKATVGSFLVSKPVTQAEHRDVAVIKSGGFGDPAAVAPNPNASQRANIAAVGSFENAAGSSHGAGANRAGTVKEGGFGSGIASGQGSGAQGAGSGMVAAAGFGSAGPGDGVSRTPAKRQANYTPPSVLSEPRPQYTAEAIRLNIQGEVTLQVRFGTDGKVAVVRLVSGLGHGLDEEAERVAQLIRFTPAVKDGQPAEAVTYIHILFQLA